MRFFAVSFLLNVKKFLLRPAFWCGLAVLPVIIALGGIFFQTGGSAVTITAGVYFNPENPLEAAIFEALEETPFTRFEAYDDVDTLLQDVRLGRIECGYIINSNIGNAKEGDFTGLVTLVTSPRTMTDPIFNDMMAAAILRASSAYITKDGLHSLFSGSSGEIEHFVTWQFAAYNEMDIFMTPVFTGTVSHMEEAGPGLEEITARRVFRGVIGLTIHILILFAAPMFIDERRHGLPKALSLHGKLVAYDISLWAAAFTAMFTLGAAGLASAAIFAPNLPAPVLLELAALAAISAICAVLLILAVRLLKSAKVIQTMGLFIIIANIAFGGVILDLTEISPQLAHFQRLFPLFWYTSL